MSNATLQLGGGNFAVKDGKLLGYATDPKTSVFVSREFDFSRSSYATRVNADGLIEKETQNLLLQSNQFDTTWGSVNTTETSGQTGYDGSSDAWLLSITASGAYLYQDKAVSGVQTFSFFAKEGTLARVNVVVNASVNVTAQFDLVNGIVLGTSQNITSSIESIGNGWYRCSVTYNQGTTSRFRLYPVDLAGGGTSGSIYIQDAQLEQGLVARDYIETTTTAVYGGITDNIARIDYTNSSSPALLLEPQRTNSLGQSEYFNAYYAKFDPDIALDTNTSETKSPAGLYNATKLISGTYNTQQAIYRNIAVATPTFTCYAKAAEFDSFALKLSGAIACNFTLTGSGSIGYNTGTSAQSIKSVGNGWYRCSISSTSNSTYAWIAISGGNTQGDNTSGIYIYGAQLEEGSYATSYIPTYGTAITRSADVPADKTLNYGSKFSLFFDMNGLGGNVSNNFIVRFGTSNPIYLSVRQSDKKLQFYSPASGAGYFATTATQKIAISCDGTNWIWSSDGASGSLTATGSNNADYVRISTDGSAGGGFASALVNQIVFFDTALTAGELNALTTL